MALSAMLLLGGAAHAQSGRRQAPPKADPPVPMPTPEPTPKPRAPTPPLALLVTVYAPLSVGLKQEDSDLVRATVLGRLHTAKDVRLDQLDSLRLDAARKRARAEPERSVVWLHLETGALILDRMPGNNGRLPDDARIQYTIFIPGTGEVRAEGSVYLRDPQRATIGTNRRCYPPFTTNLEAALWVAAVEAADRIFQTFLLPVPPIC